MNTYIYTIISIGKGSHRLAVVMNLNHERSVLQGKRVDREHVEAGDLDMKDSVMNIEPFANVDTSPAKVDVPIVVVKRVSWKMGEHVNSALATS